MVPSSGRLPPPPPWYGPGRSTGPGTWHAFTAPSLGYVPSMFAFVPALSRVPCKYHRILHHLQRLRLHQPAFPPIHNHPTHSHRGRGREPPGGGWGCPGLCHIYIYIYLDRYYRLMMATSLCPTLPAPTEAPPQSPRAPAGLLAFGPAAAARGTACRPPPPSSPGPCWATTRRRCRSKQRALRSGAYDL